MQSKILLFDVFLLFFGHSFTNLAVHVVSLLADDTNAHCILSENHMCRIFKAVNDGRTFFLRYNF